MHFQLPIWYEMGTGLLTPLRQNTATHVSDHIHEWRWCKRLVKVPFLDALLEDWFTKSLFPKISCDIDMCRIVTKEDVIRCAQHLDLIYSQSSTFYDIIPQASCPSNDQSWSALGCHVDGVIASIWPSAINQVAWQLGQLAITENLASIASTTTSTTSSQSIDVNLVQTSKTSRRKNHNQRKNNATTEQGELNIKEPNVGGNKGKKKLKFPCLDYKDDHFARDCLVSQMSINMWNIVRILHRLCSPILSLPRTRKWLLRFPDNNLLIHVQ